MPVAGAGGREEQVLTRVIRNGDKLTEERHGLCRFVPLVGRYGWQD